MQKVNIRSDLSIGDQKVGAKMNTNGLWTISEISICGLPTDQALKELGDAMQEGNKIVDEANKGREPLKKEKVIKEKEDKKEDPVKPSKAKLLKPKKSEEKKEITGGVDVKTTTEGEKKGKLFG